MLHEKLLYICIAERALYTFDNIENCLSFLDMSHFDIFISYKRKSSALASNLYHRLLSRGYSVFFDLEEMQKDDFNSHY